MKPAAKGSTLQVILAGEMRRVQMHAEDQAAASILYGVSKKIIQGPASQQAATTVLRAILKDRWQQGHQREALGRITGLSACMPMRVLPAAGACRCTSLLFGLT